MFHANLQRVVAKSGLSTNAWAKKHGLEQTLVDRLLKNQDPQLSTIIRIAGVLDLEPWQLLVADLESTNPPIIRNATEAERQLWLKYDALIQELGHLREMANTRPGKLAP